MHIQKAYSFWRYLCTMKIGNPFDFTPPDLYWLRRLGEPPVRSHFGIVRYYSHYVHAGIERSPLEGFCWHDAPRACTVFAIMPFNLVFRLIRELYWHVRVPQWGRQEENAELDTLKRELIIAKRRISVLESRLTYPCHP